MSQYVNVHDNDVTIRKIFKNARHNTYSVTSVVDPDPHGSAFNLGGWIWIWFLGSGSVLEIWIQIRIQEGKNDPQKWISKLQC
jgi:hypothetical protein